MKTEIRVLFGLIILLIIVSVGASAIADSVDIDYDSLTKEELDEIIDKAEGAIGRNHTVYSSVQSALESKTKLNLVQLMPDLEKEPSWRWFDWTYSRAWNEITVETEVKINDVWLPLEAIYIDTDGEYNLIRMTVDDEILLNKAIDDGNENKKVAAENTNDKTKIKDNSEKENSEKEANQNDNQEMEEEASIIAQKGDKNEVVKEIQTFLIRLGYLSGKADGDFGEKTKKAVISFQRNKGFEESGVVEEETYAALQSASKELPEPKEETVKYDRVSATELHKQYNENEVASDLKYKGKTIEVSGKVDSISKTWGTIYVRIKADGYGINTVACAMRKDQADAVASLKTNQNVVIRGKCTGLSILEVYLDDCKIIK